MNFHSNEWIMNRVHEHFDDALNEFDYSHIIGLFLQGSQNYGMDLYTDEYRSDIDCMAVVLPSFDDFVDSKKEVSTTRVLPNNEHINIKDIRQMFMLYTKQNIQFIETLFTKYMIKNNKYLDLISELLNMKEDIANINKKGFYMSTIGMSAEKYHSLEHPYPSIIDKIEKNNDGTYTIIDFKTGKYKTENAICPNGDNEDYYNQICLYKYFFELLFNKCYQRIR